MDEKGKSKSDVAKKEEEILEFWKKEKIYDKSRKKNSRGRKFYLMDGPPYATGHIHIGTALNKILKDIAMRMKRMQGCEVLDRPGYDTHGTPIELQVEKEIDSKSKKDIEKFGVSKFISRCKEFATRHIDLMNEEFINLGVWMDWANPYLTLSDDYIEAIWSAFKEADKKGLLYLGKYPVHVCPRCETAVAFNEIEYSKQKDTSVFVKFPLKKKKNTFLVIFTTTPWTLPGNTGIMVNPDLIYQEIELANGEKWVIAKELAAKLMGEIERAFTPKAEYKGEEMEDWEYENPLSKDLKLKIKNGYRVVLSKRYVTIEEGTGLVHCAPGHGKEDYEVGKEYGLDMPSPVASNGLLTAEAGKYAGKKAREVDEEIIQDLEKEGYLVHKKIYEHDYPLCWRDKSPLLMISQPQWFLKISDIQGKLLLENEKNNWVPKFMGARMKAWLEGISDWPVSRQRYWGAPLPIWYNEKTGEKIVVGSIKELKKLSGKKKIEMHKPGIDNIEIKGKKGMIKRVLEVLDVWFDSGVSSWAALGYPASEAKFKKYWPADLNIEGKDQIRGWWNSQMILSQITFGKKPFDNIIVHGMILDLGKKKMSKSLGNVVAPAEIIAKFGRDYLRYYFAKLSKGEDFSYDEKEFGEIDKSFKVLININTFVNQIEKGKGIAVEDKWILSKYNSLVKSATENYNSYRFPEAVQALEAFILNDLSRTYIKMIRERAEEAYEVLNEIRIGLLKLLAPICPFVTEKIWRELLAKKIVKEESIHLSELPKTDAGKIDEKLEKEFEVALQVIEAGLRERDKAQIGLKWPLASAKIELNENISKEVEEIIARQLNVKKINVGKGKELAIVLDTKITPALEAEGYARVVSREVQAARKKAGLQVSDKIELALAGDKETVTILKKTEGLIKERTNALRISIAEKETGKYAHHAVGKVKEKEFRMFFSRV